MEEIPLAHVHKESIHTANAAASVRATKGHPYETGLPNPQATKTGYRPSHCPPTPDNVTLIALGRSPPAMCPAWTGTPSSQLAQSSGGPPCHGYEQPDYLCHKNASLAPNANTICTRSPPTITTSTGAAAHCRQDKTPLRERTTTTTTTTAGTICQRLHTNVWPAGDPCDGRCTTSTSNPTRTASDNTQPGVNRETP